MFVGSEGFRIHGRPQGQRDVRYGAQEPGGRMWDS